MWHEWVQQAKVGAITAEAQQWKQALVKQAEKKNACATMMCVLTQLTLIVCPPHFRSVSFLQHCHCWSP